MNYGNRHRWGGAAVGALAMLSTGCFVETSSAPPPPVVVQASPGRLTVRWTVDEANDPNLCFMGQATTIDIVVTSTQGSPMGEFQAPCSSFATTISTLYPGSYRASAVLLSDGAARTTAVLINDFSIIENTELVVDVDFPAEAFH